jgi:hypothetical protein
LLGDKQFSLTPPRFPTTIPPPRFQHDFPKAQFLHFLPLFASWLDGDPTSGNNQQRKGSMHV